MKFFPKRNGGGVFSGKTPTWVVVYEELDEEFNAEEFCSRNILIKFVTEKRDIKNKSMMIYPPG